MHSHAERGNENLYRQLQVMDAEGRWCIFANNIQQYQDPVAAFHGLEYTLLTYKGTINNIDLIPAFRLSNFYLLIASFIFIGFQVVD